MPIDITNENFEAEIKKSETPVIMDFWAGWCGPCQMMGPVFEDLSKDYEGQLKFAKVDTDTQQEIAGGFDISGIPCLIVAKDGKEVDRIVGFMPKDALKEKIDSIMSKIN